MKFIRIPKKKKKLKTLTKGRDSFNSFLVCCRYVWLFVLFNFSSIYLLFHIIINFLSRFCCCCCSSYFHHTTHLLHHIRTRINSIHFLLDINSKLFGISFLLIFFFRNLYDDTQATILHTKYIYLRRYFCLCVCFFWLFFQD